CVSQCNELPSAGCFIAVAEPKLGRVGLEITSVSDRCGLFDSKGARVVGLCRTMEHEIGSGSPAPGCQARSAEGVMVRRLSVASLDSGAESPVYGEEPSASADRGSVVNPPRANGDGRRAVGGGQVAARWYLAP